MASGTQSFAAQDIFNPGASAEWRLLNPACDRSSEFYAQAEVLLTQAPVIFSRGMTKADLHNIKKRLVLPMLESPCNPKRYMPHGVPPSDEPFFSTALVNAQTVVCKQENRLELSDESVSKYKKKLYQLDYRTSGIERYHPPQTARMVGIEHTFTFSLNLIWGFDMKECSHEDPDQDDYWCWSKTLANLAVSETVTVVKPPDQEACMSDGSDVEATSVTACGRSPHSRASLGRKSSPIWPTNWMSSGRMSTPRMESGTTSSRTSASSSAGRTWKGTARRRPPGSEEGVKHQVYRRTGLARRGVCRLAHPRVCPVQDGACKMDCLMRALGAGSDACNTRHENAY